jgi:nitrogenase molybdenum-iron protein NifN
MVGYRGTRDLVFDIANLIIADQENNRQPTPETWRHGFDSLKGAQATSH